MSEILHTLLAWMAAHPGLTTLFVFLTAFFESLILVGILIPGALIMFGLGALVTTGHIPLSHLLIFGSLGAITGDCLSFWLGRHFKDHLLDMWPFNRYPTLIKTGTDFIKNHGGKGVFMARFIGPIRPVVPAVAGMLNMPVGRFLAIDVIAGILWTPAYVLPGAAFGASLNLASEVAMRLVILLISGIVLIWLLQWGCRKTVLLLHRHSQTMLAGFQKWGHQHKYIGKPIGAIVDPEHPEIKGMLTLAFLLLIISWGLLLALISFTDATEHLRVNEQVHQLLQQLKIPATDTLMLLIQELSNPFVHFSAFISIAIWLAWKRHWQPFAHWVAAISFGLLLAVSLRWMIATGFMGIHLQAMDINPPSGQITVMISVLGFFTVLIAHKMALKHRWIPYTLTAFWISSSIIANLYLGTVGLLGVTGGVAFGIAWLVLVGTAYRTHIQHPIPTKGLLIIFISSWVAAGTWSLQLNWKNELAKLNPIPTYNIVSLTSWQKDGWRSQPNERIDLAKKPDEPLTIQWAGDIKKIRLQLEDQGWSSPPELTLTNTLFWLSSSSPNVPLPPRAHNGTYEALVLIKKHLDNNIVLRLWPSLTKISHNQTLTPLWLGNISTYQIVHPLPMLSIPKTLPFSSSQTTHDFLKPRTLNHRRHATVLLIRPPP